VAGIKQISSIILLETACCYCSSLVLVNDYDAAAVVVVDVEMKIEGKKQIKTLQAATTTIKTQNESRRRAKQQKTVIFPIESTHKNISNNKWTAIL